MLTNEELEAIRAQIDFWDNPPEDPNSIAVMKALIAEVDRLSRLDALAREWLKAEDAWLNSDMGTIADIETSKASGAARVAYRRAVEGEG